MNRAHRNQNEKTEMSLRGSKATEVIPAKKINR